LAGLCISRTLCSKRLDKSQQQWRQHAACVTGRAAAADERPRREHDPMAALAPNECVGTKEVMESTSSDTAPLRTLRYPTSNGCIEQDSSNAITVLLQCATCNLCRTSWTAEEIKKPQQPWHWAGGSLYGHDASTGEAYTDMASHSLVQACDGSVACHGASTTGEQEPIREQAIKALKLEIAELRLSCHSNAPSEKLEHVEALARDSHEKIDALLRKGVEHEAFRTQHYGAVKHLQKLIYSRIADLDEAFAGLECKVNDSVQAIRRDMNEAAFTRQPQEGLLEPDVLQCTCELEPLQLQAGALRRSVDKGIA